MALFRRNSKDQQEANPVQVDSGEESPKFVLPQPPKTDALGRRSVASQRDYLVSLVEPLQPFGMGLLEGFGLTVSENIEATTNLPSEDIATVDGYAVRAGFAIPGARVECKKVQAGQPLPFKTDAVIPGELAAAEGQLITIKEQILKGSNVRLQGSTVRIGDVLVSAGEPLDSRLSGLLAGAGFDRVIVHPRVRVVVLNLVEEQSVDSRTRAMSDVNAHLIAAGLRSDNAQVWQVNIQTGDDQQLKRTISDQLIRADLVIAAAGLASQQLVKVIAEMGQLDEASLSLAPGGHIAFGLLGEDQIPIAVLPSDPVAAYGTYQALVRPVVRRLMGASKIERPLVECRLTKPVESTFGSTQLCCAKVSHRRGMREVTPLGDPNAQGLRDLAESNAMIVLDPGTTRLDIGDDASVWIFGEE